MNVEFEALYEEPCSCAGRSVSLAGGSGLVGTRKADDLCGSHEMQNTMPDI